ncbi:cad, partial [Drosophila busckii]
MVSHYYNSLPYTQKHSAANLAYASAAAAGQPWNWTPNYTPPNHQFLGEVDSPHAAHHAHQMYYSPHHMFHSAAAAGAGEWHSPASSTAPGDNFAHNPVPTTAHQLMQHHHAHISSGLASGGSSSSASSGSTSSPVVGASAGATQLNETNGSIGAETAAHQHHQQQQQQQQQQQLAAEGLPSPPITVSGSEISSPGAPNSASSPHHLTHHLATAGSNNNNNNSPSTHNNNNNNNSITANNNHRGSPAKAQYYEWMKKPSYPAQPQPGKTRTKDKYRVVYTDFQRLELEKEYCTSRYITIRRKSELAQTLSLSERQVKIWFQNRRAKERKQNKKGDPNVMGGVQHTDYSQLLDAKTKLEPGLHLQHPLHSMNPMAAMNIPAMRLHPHLAAH